MRGVVGGSFGGPERLCWTAGGAGHPDHRLCRTLLGRVDTPKVNESPRDPQIARLVVLASELSARVDEQSLAIGDVKAQLNGLWMTSGSANGEVTWTFRRRKSKIGFERSA